MSQFLRALANVTSVALVASGRQTVTGNGTGVDMQAYDGTVYVASYYGAGGGTTPTFDLKLQHSDDNSAFTDIPGAAFVQMAASLSEQQLILDVSATKRYWRSVRTIAGTTPTFDGACVAIVMKKQMP